MSKCKVIFARALSTPDLLRLLPEAVWQPNSVPIDDLFYLPISSEINGSVRICQSPTRKDLKNTNEFGAAMEEIQHTYPHVEKVIIENSTHLDCLKIKQTCDIHFDHMQGYFGVSSLEGLSQGKPVVAGLDEWNQQYIKEFTGAWGLPWVVAETRDELENYFEKLIVDTELRISTGMESRRFMEEHWAVQQILEMLFEFYGDM